MEVKFKIATSEDVENIILLCNECFEENTDLQYAKKIFEETKDDNNQIYLIGEIDGQIVAHTKITIIPTMYGKMGTYSILNHVCVKPEFRRQNIATKMLVECEKISKEHGCVSMDLWSMNFRQPAQECYKHYGFKAKNAKFFSKEIK